MAQYFGFLSRSWLLAIPKTRRPWRSPALEQEARRVGLLRFLQNLNDDAIMPSSPYKLWTLRPRGGIEPLHVPMSLALKSSPDPSRNHGGPLAHIRVVTSRPLSPGAVVPEPCLGCPPKNSLGRRARRLWGPALEQEALAGMPPKKLSRTLRQEALGPSAGTGSPCRDASSKTLQDAALGSWPLLGAHCTLKPLTPPDFPMSAAL